MNIKNKFISKLEEFFFLSPLIVLLIFIFNIADTKYILSRLIPIVIIYALIKYRNAIKENLHSQIRLFLACGLLVVVTFSLYHFIRDDEFSLPRTLIASLAYLIFVPWKRINPQMVCYIIAIAAIVCGLNAFHERYVLNIYRVGISTNPIPYALYVSFLVLSCVYLLLISQSKKLKLLASIGGLLSLSAIIMTDVRGVILFLPVAIIYLVITTIKPIWKYYIASILSIILLSGVFYTIFQPKINARIAQTQNEIALIKQGNLTSSIGIRLDLWMHGVEIIAQNPLFGVGDSGLQESLSQMTNRGAATQPHLHNQYLDLLARYGIVGTLVIFLFCLALVLNLKNSGFEYIGNPLVNSMLVMLIFAGLTDVPLHHTHIIYLLTILCGLLIRFSERNA
ncbi:O-antigen ligase family protein [Vibrio cholerae]|uniref:O-antigen ligase family protein n=1 Tax=Vibrio cholerae TaxID=666 RepID=UPI001C66CF4C|nr:O-antigen ligase family protein [Vibrio cholerae]EGR4205412.1 O-antigen ligase domain-containing protein [Vibrio cholerae]EGR4229084.1 O-antigen ligase domain-containing protein [Vibrio cholerae]EGR4328216.1 O-antigen ligase domain-containing protein [Vibrio cholerae]EJC1072857.1 O-antigen ligase family protein [Vibrio cholerae]EJK2192460.1 O-antigen ligase family protein [Vibrio cholerae]